MRYAGGAVPDVAAAARSLSIGLQVFHEHGVCLWPVVRKTDNALIGCCGFHNDAETGGLELAYHFKRSAWGKGFATEAARACMTYAREGLRPTHVLAWAHPDNPASWKILERLGFHFVGMDEGERAYRCDFDT